MNKDRYFCLIRSRILADSVPPLINNREFYYFFIMYPEEPKVPANKYEIELRTEHAGEIRRILHWIDEGILKRGGHYSYSDRVDVFECFFMAEQVYPTFFEPHARHQAKTKLLLDILDNFQSLLREDIQTIRLHVYRYSS